MINRVSAGRILFVIFTLLVLSVTPQSIAEVKSISGKLCPKAASQQLENAALFSCVTVGSVLRWQITDDGTSSYAPFPISGPTWQQLADTREAAIKAAADLLAKQASELRAQQEAAAKAAADAKAAKAAAEIPQISGLVIGKLLWSDDFLGSKGATIDSKKWSARNCHRVPTSLGGGACFDSEVVYYAPSAITLDGSVDGAAVIATNRFSGALPADAGKCLTNSCSFVSGRFDTHGKVAFQYGFIEARIKMPAGSGNHPAFWMLGDNINQVGWPNSGEMDISEVRGNEPTIATSATHYSTRESVPYTCCGNHQYKVASLNVGADLSVDFHTYAVAWLPNSISYYVDGRLISRTTPQNLGGYWSFNSKFFLILNNAVNAGFSGSWQNLTSSTMTVDWVRSYQLNGLGEVFEN